MYFNPMYFLFVLPALLLGMWAQARVQSAYKKYLQVGNERGMTGVEAGQYLLQANGLGQVGIEGTAGQLTDHYDPRDKKLYLSQNVANSRSLAGLSIVAHEVGHAVQDATNYGPLKLRMGIVPMVQAGSALGPILFMAGWFFQATSLATVGLILFSLSAVFALVTLPVERNASARALQMLRSNGLIQGGQEEAGVRKVLDAAALTYVAALVQVVATLLYYVMLLSGMGGRRRS
jgi:Zn-dependent membrane protease YugP